MHLLEVAMGHRWKIALATALALTCGFAASRKPSARGRVVVTDSQTTILDVVEFSPGTANLRDTSRPILDAVAETLLGNPSIEQVEVQSHTSGTGDAAVNQALSQQRAERVAAYLVGAGVEPSRLVATGYGDTQPVVRTEPSKNERISFVIQKRSSSEQACTRWEGSVSGNDPSVHVAATLCEHDGQVSGMLVWKSDRSGTNTRSLAGTRTGESVVLHDTELSGTPNPGWRFCRIDEYALSGAGTDALSGTYVSRACRDRATISLHRVR